MSGLPQTTKDMADEGDWLADLLGERYNNDAIKVMAVLGLTVDRLLLGLVLEGHEDIASDWLNRLVSSRRELLRQ